MKNFLILTTMFVALTAISFAQLSGTAHDFTDGDVWNTMTTNKACGPCHTPHNASATVTDAPLWAHSETAATPTPYTGGASMDATPGAVGGVSLLCLGCHDGTLNVNDHIFGADDAVMPGSVVGTDLSNDHPISFTYNTALSVTDGALADPAVVNSGMGSTIDADMLFSGSMECASCHDPHGTGITRLLKIVNTDSELCLTCHTK